MSGSEDRDVGDVDHGEAGLAMNPGPPLGLPELPRVEDALPIGTRVVKINSAPLDHHQNGALATVHGVFSHDGYVFGYKIEWDDAPGTPFFIAPIQRVKPL